MAYSVSNVNSMTPNGMAPSCWTVLQMGLPACAFAHRPDFVCSRLRCELPSPPPTSPRVRGARVAHSLSAGGPVSRIPLYRRVPQHARGVFLTAHAHTPFSDSRQLVVFHSLSPLFGFSATQSAKPQEMVLFSCLCRFFLNLCLCKFFFLCYLHFFTYLPSFFLSSRSVFHWFGSSLTVDNNGVTRVAPRFRFSRRAVPPPPSPFSPADRHTCVPLRVPISAASGHGTTLTGQGRMYR